jgi:ribosomal protein S12 methylthiotransferase
VVGCLVERFGAELKKTLPEVDSFISTDQILKIGQAIEGSFVEELKAKGRPYFLYDEQSPREISGAPHSAYVKIAEGCDRPCSFCIIPKIRGAMRSRSIRSIVSEAEALGRQGVREINLIAQDLTAFGKDQRPGAPQADLPALLEALDQSAAVPWVRLLYCYPIGTDVRLLKTMARLPSVCEYIDIPLQHSSERVLKAMQRPLGRYAPRPLVQLIRKEAPNLHIRSTFIVGFPGESEADIKDLEEFIKQGHFSHVGIFSYSKEDGTPAAELKGHLPQKEKDVRRDHLMRIQREVNAQRLKGFIGRTLPVLLEGRHADTDLLLCGRTRFQAPEVDGQVIINEIDAKISPQNLSNASIIDVEISDVSGYDLLGKVVQGDNKL